MEEKKVVMCLKKRYFSPRLQSKVSTPMISGSDPLKQVFFGPYLSRFPNRTKQIGTDIFDPLAIRRMKHRLGTSRRSNLYIDV